MAITEAFSGSASVSTTEFSFPSNSTTLTPQTDDGVYQLFLDLSDMVAGDKLRVRVYEKVTSSGTQRVVWEKEFVDAQSEAVALPSLVLLHGWDMTGLRTAGTDVTVVFSGRKVA